MVAPARQVARQLREAGQRAEAPYAPMKVGKAFKAAELAGATEVVLVGPDEWANGEVQVKNLTTGEQTTRSVR
jgi:histidyl-tRNA synthetase